MNQQEKKKIADIITGAAELLNRDLSPVAMGLYVKAVEDLPFEKVSAGFSELIRRNKFFPAPAEVRELIEGPEDRLEDRALIEYNKVITAVRRFGHHGPAEFEHPVTMAVIDYHFGGWQRFCDLPSKDGKWTCKDFIKSWVAYSRESIRNPGSLIDGVGVPKKLAPPSEKLEDRREEYQNLIKNTFKKV